MCVGRDECLPTFATRADVYHRHCARGVVRNVPDPIFMTPFLAQRETTGEDRQEQQPA
jgi:hypothetical protein